MKIHGAFIAATSPIEGVPTDELYDSMIYGVGGYTPRLFRRRRLHALAPVVCRIHLVRALWRWSAKAGGPPDVLLRLPCPSPTEGIRNDD